jgi:hypothetical protein
MYVQVLNLTNMEPKVCHIMLWIYDIIENNLIIMGDATFGFMQSKGKIWRSFSSQPLVHKYLTYLAL